MGRRTNLRLAQSKPPLGQGFRGFDRQRQNLGLHRLRTAAHQEISLPIEQPIRLRFGHLDDSSEARNRMAYATSSTSPGRRIGMTLMRSARTEGSAVRPDVRIGGMMPG